MCISVCKGACVLLYIGIVFQKRHWREKSFKKKKKGHFAHIGNEIKICSQNKCHHHLSNVCENSFHMLHSNWVISDYHSFGQFVRFSQGNSNCSKCYTWKTDVQQRAH